MSREKLPPNETPEKGSSAWRERIKDAAIIASPVAAVVAALVLTPWGMSIYENYKCADPSQELFDTVDKLQRDPLPPALQAHTLIFRTSSTPAAIAANVGVHLPATDVTTDVQHDILSAPSLADAIRIGDRYTQQVFGGLRLTAQTEKRTIDGGDVVEPLTSEQLASSEHTGKVGDLVTTLSTTPSETMKAAGITQINISGAMSGGFGGHTSNGRIDLTLSETDTTFSVNHEIAHEIGEQLGCEINHDDTFEELNPPEFAYNEGRGNDPNTKLTAIEQETVPSPYALTNGQEHRAVLLGEGIMSTIERKTETPTIQKQKRLLLARLGTLSKPSMEYYTGLLRIRNEATGIAVD